MSKLNTPLPEKIPEKNFIKVGETNYLETINQLIDIVAELWEVVEEQRQMSDQEKLIRDLTPNLKDQLLGAVRNLKSSSGTAVSQGYNVALSDVEAIINRLIP